MIREAQVRQSNQEVFDRDLLKKACNISESALEIATAEPDIGINANNIKYVNEDF